MTSEPATPPKRAGLPAWIKILLVLGAVCAALLLVLTIVPVLFMVWLMGSGDQVDTRALPSSQALGVFHLEPDLSDPGVAAMLEHLTTTLPELQTRMRRAQGYPEWLNQLEAMRNTRNAEATFEVMLPTQATLSLEPGQDAAIEDDDLTLMGAVNLPAWGRGARLGMWLGARMQQELASNDPSLAAVQRVEVDGNTLYVQGSSDGEVFWGALDSTLLGGGGRNIAMVRGMERMLAGQREPLEPALQQAMDLLGDEGWQAWGAMVHQPATVAKIGLDPYADTELSAEQVRMLEAMMKDGAGEVPEDLELADGDAREAEPTTIPRSCLAELEHAGALAFGADVVGEDQLRFRLAIRIEGEQGRVEAEACLREICDEYEQDLAESALELRCSYDPQPNGVVGTAELTGIQAATARFLEHMEAELERQRQEDLQRQLPPELQDIQELEGLEF
jgi:hypothetical protein